MQESKSGKKRMIPMDDTLYATLRALLSRFERGKVFSFESTVLTAGVQDLRFHDLRHTFASHLVMNGVAVRLQREWDIWGTQLRDSWNRC